MVRKVGIDYTKCLTVVNGSLIVRQANYIIVFLMAFSLVFSGDFLTTDGG
jgi:hypothetical protein